MFMPQMMPKESMTLYVMFLTTFLTFNIMNYYMHMTMSKKLITKKHINMSTLNWKW